MTPLDLEAAERGVGNCSKTLDDIDIDDGDDRAFESSYAVASSALRHAEMLLAECKALRTTVAELEHRITEESDAHTTAEYTLLDELEAARRVVEYVKRHGTHKLEGGGPGCTCERCALIDAYDATTVGLDPEVEPLYEPTVAIVQAKIAAWLSLELSRVVSTDMPLGWVVEKLLRGDWRQK